MKSKCEGENEEYECHHCEGTGDDTDFSGRGYCPMCDGKGFVERWKCYGCEECNWLEESEGVG